MGRPLIDAQPVVQRVAGCRPFAANADSNPPACSHVTATGGRFQSAPVVVHAGYGPTRADSVKGSKWMEAARTAVLGADADRPMPGVLVVRDDRAADV